MLLLSNYLFPKAYITKVFYYTSLLIPKFPHPLVYHLLYIVLVVYHIHIKIKIGREDFWVHWTPYQDYQSWQYKERYHRTPSTIPSKIIVFIQSGI